MDNLRDIHISGGGKVGGGRCGSVSISGSGKIQGDLECDSFHVSGAGKIEDGSLTVHGAITCSGAAKVGGAITAVSARVSGSLHGESCAAFDEAVTVSGSFKTEGDLKTGSLSVSGVCKAEGCVSGNEIDVSGVLKAEGDVQAERFRSSGALSIDGLLNAETVEIQLSGDAMVHSIGGGSVLVRKKTGGFSLLGIPRRNHLSSELIEADEIDLEYTDCETVRGVNVRIGPECVIDRVEYSGTLSTAPYATVRKKVKL